MGHFLYGDIFIGLKMIFCEIQIITFTDYHLLLPNVSIEGTEVNAAMT